MLRQAKLRILLRWVSRRLFWAGKLKQKMETKTQSERIELKPLPIRVATISADVKKQVVCLKKKGIRSREIMEITGITPYALDAIWAEHLGRKEHRAKNVKTKLGRKEGGK